MRLFSEPAVFITMIMRNFITVADRQNPGWKGPALIGWTGNGCVVSLAPALSIPLTLQDGTPFSSQELDFIYHFRGHSAHFGGSGFDAAFSHQKIQNSG